MNIYINMPTDDQLNAIIYWQNVNGGLPITPKAMMLKALEEMVELCFAAGANTYDVFAVVESEISKAMDRKDDMGEFKREQVFDEMGDTLVSILVAAYYNNIDLREGVAGTLKRIAEREWEPDRNGILRRPRT